MNLATGVHVAAGVAVDVIAPVVVAALVSGIDAVAMIDTVNEHAMKLDEPIETTPTKAASTCSRSSLIEP